MDLRLRGDDRGGILITRDCKDGDGVIPSKEGIQTKITF